MNFVTIFFVQIVRDVEDKWMDEVKCYIFGDGSRWTELYLEDYIKIRISITARGSVIIGNVARSIFLKIRLLLLWHRGYTTYLAFYCKNQFRSANNSNTRKKQKSSIHTLTRCTVYSCAKWEDSAFYLS